MGWGTGKRRRGASGWSGVDANRRRRDKAKRAQAAAAKVAAEQADQERVLRARTKLIAMGSRDVGEEAVAVGGVDGQRGDDGLPNNEAGLQAILDEAAAVAADAEAAGVARQRRLAAQRQAKAEAKAAAQAAIAAGRTELQTPCAPRPASWTRALSRELSTATAAVTAVGPAVEVQHTGSVRRVVIERYGGGQQHRPNALVVARSVASGEVLFRERLRVLSDTAAADAFERLAVASAYPEPVLDLPGHRAAALVAHRAADAAPAPAADPRSTLYMMNHARGRDATVASPFKHRFLGAEAGAEWVLITAHAARGLEAGTELTWDYNPSKAKRFSWEPELPPRPARDPAAPKVKRRKRAATGWDGDDARKRAKARRAKARREASECEATRPACVDGRTMAPA